MTKLTLRASLKILLTPPNHILSKEREISKVGLESTFRKVEKKILATLEARAM